MVRRDPGRPQRPARRAADAHRDEVIDQLSQENGNIRPEASFEYDMCAPKLRYAAALALTDYGRAMEVRPGNYSMTVRLPVGVASVIVPWNSPVVLMIRSVAPALAAGCTVAVKMPAQTALTNALLFGIIAKAKHLPPVSLISSTKSATPALPPRLLA